MNTDNNQCLWNSATNNWSS